MTKVPFTRLFSMGAFEALRVLRLERFSFPGVKPHELASLLGRVRTDGSAADFAAAIELDLVVESKAPTSEAPVFYRYCIEGLVIHTVPIWARMMTLGREKFAQKLSRDEYQCFREAGLMASPPTDAIVRWWDHVSGAMRFADDQEKMERARFAERLSFESEERRLADLGIASKPRWIALEDNTAGYDILSFDPSDFEPTNRLIEVKSTIHSPLRFILTRNEWDHALKVGDAYHFHVWDLSATPPRLFERTAIEIAKHVPVDGADGIWCVADIPVD